MPVSMVDLKAVIVAAIQGTDSFADYQSSVLPYRLIEPGGAGDIAGAKLGSLSAFVAIDRIQKGDEDFDPVKKVAANIDIWINAWSENQSVAERDSDLLTLRDGSPVVQAVHRAEDILVDVIDALEALTTEEWETGGYKQRLAFQDAFRLADAPKPFLVYRIITQLETVIGNE
jgi:hypothetical protein